MQDLGSELIDDISNDPKVADVASELTQLRSDFGRLAESVAELVKSQTQSAASTVREHATNAGNAIASNFADLGASATKMTNGAQASVQSASHDLEASIERNPLTAVTIAAGIGLVLGLVASRP